MIGVEQFLGGAISTLEALMRAGFGEEAGGWSNRLLLDAAGNPDDLHNRQAGG